MKEYFQQETPYGRLSGTRMVFAVAHRQRFFSCVCCRQQCGKQGATCLKKVAGVTAMTHHYLSQFMVKTAPMIYVSAAFEGLNPWQNAIEPVHVLDLGVLDLGAMRLKFGLRFRR